MSRLGTAAAFGIAAAALGGCGDGGDGGRAAADLRARVEAQASEVESLRKEVRALEARSRGLEERLSAASPGARPAAPSPAAPGAAAPGEGGAGEAGAGAAPAAASPTAAAVAEYLDTEDGRQKLRAFLASEEVRRREEDERRTRDRAIAAIKERVSGTLAEQLGLDPQQQQTVITIATDAFDKSREIWAGMRDAQGDPAALNLAREKGQQIRTEAMDRLRQALTAEQFTKIQEPGMLGGFGFPGMGGPRMDGGGGRGPFPGGGGGGR